MSGNQKKKVIHETIDMKWKLKKNNSNFNIEIKSLGPVKKEKDMSNDTWEKLNNEFKVKEKKIIESPTPTLLITFTGKKPKEFESKSTMLFRTVHYKINIKMNNSLIKKLEEKFSSSSYTVIVDGQYCNEQGEWGTYRPHGKLGIQSRKEEEGNVLKATISFSKIKGINDKGIYEYDFRLVLIIARYGDGETESLYVLESSNFRSLSKPGVYANQIQKNSVTQVNQPEWTKKTSENVAYSQSLPDFENKQQTEDQFLARVSSPEMFNTPQLGTPEMDDIKSPVMQEDHFGESRKFSSTQFHSMESPAKKRVKLEGYTSQQIMFTPPLTTPSLDEEEDEEHVETMSHSFF